MLNPVAALGGLASAGGAAINAPVTTALSAGGAALGGGLGIAATRGVRNALGSDYLANRLISGSLGTQAPQAVPNMLSGKLGLPNPLTYATGLGARANQLTAQQPNQ